MEDNTSNNNNLIAFGKNAAVELLQSKTDIDSVLLAESMDQKTASYYVALAKDKGAVIKWVPAAQLNDYSDGAPHQGVVAIASAVKYYSLNDLFDIAQERNEAPFFLILDELQDPHNVGALMRTALLCGVHGVIMPRRRNVSVTPAVMSASAGAAALLPVARVANVGEAIRKIKKENVFVYGAEADGTPLEKTNLSGAVALVVGNEEKGLSKLVRDLCDGVVSLSMRQKGTIDSYNVSVAGGIIMYDINAKR